MNATLKLPAELEALEKLDDFIKQLSEGHDARVHTQLLLAVHELCMNIVQHAYNGQAGTIQVHAVTDDQSIQFEIQDTAAIAYQESSVIAPDPLDLPEHGWGMVILERVMDNVEYQRKEDGNHWYLKKGW